MDPRHDNVMNGMMNGNAYAHQHQMATQMPGGVPPPIFNPPPQMYGHPGYGVPLAHDGLPNMGMADMSQGYLPDPTMIDESMEAKRRRIARACDMCRKKKIKCDGKMPECTHCANYHTQCVFTQVEKKRNPPKSGKYIESMEIKCGRYENIMRLSGVIKEGEDLGDVEKRLMEKHRLSIQPGSNATSPTQASPNEDPESTSHSTVASPAGSESQNKATPKNAEKDAGKEKEKRKSGSPEEEKEEVEALSDMMCSLVTNNCGETRYIGSSSGFSIFSPKGIQWVNEKTGDSSFQEMISSASVDENKWMYWKPEVFGDLFHRPIYKQLPTKTECLSLMKDFFENFNCMFPLFHQPTFMYLVERQYSDDPYDGSGWWASLNVALAIAHRLRVMSGLVPEEEDEKAWGYLKNAMGVITELTLRNTDLLSVQALLGMAAFLQGTPNPQPTFFLVAAAIRLSHSIGLHKRGSGFSLNPIEIEQRSRVFWIAYMLDKDICLRSGRPPAQDDDDMNVELPTADPDDNIGNIPLADGKGKVNLFRLMCEFATIESKVYKQLYSTKAAKQSDGELLNTIGELDTLLEEWKDSIPIDFRPEHEIKASHTPLILHVVMLHFAYYNCLTTIHRMSIHHGYWTSRLSDYAHQGLNARPLNPRVFSSAALCVSAARASIHLIKYIPQNDCACVWLILYFPVSALVTLFGNILQTPSDQRARQDVRLMNLVVTFLTALGTDGENGGVKRMLGVCSEFERIAKVVLDKAEKESSSRRKRKNNDEQTAKTKAPIPHNSTIPPPQMPNAQPPAMAGVFSPGMGNGSLPNGYNPMPPATNGSPNFPSDFNGGEYMSPNGMTPYPEIQAYGQNQQNPGEMSSPPMMNTFAQPFVPQDLWQMPMSLEWDWADMTGGAYPSFENGVVGDMRMQNMNGNEHLGHQGPGQGQGPNGRM